jgi:hypothetical protein
MPPPFVMHVKYHTGWIPIVTKSIKPKLEEKKKEEQKKRFENYMDGNASNLGLDLTKSTSYDVMAGMHTSLPSPTHTHTHMSIFTLNSNEKREGICMTTH